MIARRGWWVLALIVCAQVASGAPVPAERIVTLAPNLTELTFSAGAGERIVGTVEYSDEPEQARRIPRIGDAFRVDLERLVALQPDIVLAWGTGTPAALIERIRALGLRIETLETNRIADVATSLRAIGELAGTSDTAARAADRFERDIAALRAQFSGRPPLRVFVQINDRPLYTINGRQIMSEALELCGGENVFGHLPEVAPTVSVEAVIAANPQVIAVTDDVTREPRELWRKWTHIEAVRTGNIYPLAADDISRATVRLAAGARELCRTLDTARTRLRIAAD